MRGSLAIVTAGADPKIVGRLLLPSPTQAPRVDEIREPRRGRGPVHGWSISNETVGHRRSRSAVSVAAISGLIAALS